LAYNMKDRYNIYIVGKEVDFLHGCKLIRFKDSEDKACKNVCLKTKLACEIEELSDEFLFMNDDFFMLEEFYGADFPFYALKNSNGGNCGMHSFQVHCPIRFKKDWYAGMPIALNIRGNYSPRTFYANFY